MKRMENSFFPLMSQPPTMRFAYATNILQIEAGVV
jgi:hypothetical protein